MHNPPIEAKRRQRIKGVWPPKPTLIERADQPQSEVDRLHLYVDTLMLWQDVLLARSFKSLPLYPH